MRRDVAWAVQGMVVGLGDDLGTGLDLGVNRGVDGAVVVRPPAWLAPEGCVVVEGISDVHLGWVTPLGGVESVVAPCEVQWVPLAASSDALAGRVNIPERCCEDMLLCVRAWDIVDAEPERWLG